MKMAMRGLVEPDCGGVNPLVRLTNRYTADRARVAEGVGREVTSTSREAVGDGRVSSQGLVRFILFTAGPFPYLSQKGSGVPGGDSGGGCEAESHFQDGFAPL